MSTASTTEITDQPAPPTTEQPQSSTKRSRDDPPTTKEKKEAAAEAKRIKYLKPSKIEMICFVDIFLRFQKWQWKTGFNHFGNDIVAFLGPRREEYGDEACKELWDILNHRNK